MAKSNGITSLKQAAKLLNKHAPDGESLAYINPDEGRLLKAHGGSGIQTLAGVPSYDNWFTDYIWDPVKDWAIERYKDSPDAVKNIAGDLGKAYVTYEAYKGRKDLNEWEQAEHDRALADIEAGRAEFARNVGQAPLQITNMPSRTDLADVKNIDWSGSTDLDLTTTAVAQGGRIGYNMGGIDTPFQGIGALNPRMGYYNGSPHGVDVPTFSEGVQQMYESGPAGVEQITDEGFYESIKPMGTLEQDISGKPQLERDDLVSQKVMDMFKQLVEMRNRGMIDETLSDEDLISTAWRNVKGNYLGERTQEYKPENLGLAHGGRIGYNLGGIGALNPRMGYALGEEVEQVTEEVTPFSKIPENIKKADLNDIPNWWLTDFEELIEAFRNDNNGQNPTSINELEKWHRFKYGKAQGPNIDEMLNIGDTQMAKGPEEPEELEGMTPETHPSWFENGVLQHALWAKGGRIGAQSGGIMPLLDMGGMEKDYRQDGGFVPIGRKEKADDVPARLSKNEFVFTADAVKAAGGGDIDEGAQRMYNVMKNLEAGGEISEQSQGKA